MPPTEIVCDSRVESVVVYARGALVTRAVALPPSLPAEPIDLVVGGVTPLAEPGGVRAELEGGREIVALRSRLHLPAAPQAPGALAERVLELDREREALDAERTRVRERRAELGTLAFSPEGDARARRRLDPVARFGDALAAAELVGEIVAELDARLRELDAALARNERAREAAQLAASQGRSDERAAGARATYQFVLRLAYSEAEARALSVTYAVRAARWWPAYAARLSPGASRAEWALGALVAQASGEDWSGVRLALSTADLAHDARLPELPSLRLGRAQPPARKGYRPPPPGLDAMFAAYDLAVQSSPPPPRTRPPPPRQAAYDAPMPPGAHDAYAGLEGGMLADHDLEEVTAVGEDDITGVTMPVGGVRARAPAALPTSASFNAVAPPASARHSASGGYGGPPVPAAGAPPPAAPMMAPMQMPPLAAPMTPSMQQMPPPPGAYPTPAFAMARQASSKTVSFYDRGGGAPPQGAAAPSPPAEIEPDEGWLDFDALTLGAADDRARRGRLGRDGAPVAAGRGAEAQRSLESMPPPPRAQDPLATRGVFDHRYDARGAADVPSDGRPHRLTLATAEAEVRTRLRVVPRESADVFREAEVKNPFDAPLLAGPVDVFVEGALLTTAPIGAVDRGGLIALGLGVEERVRAARNARVEEASAGLLGGAAAIDHVVTIDLTSSLGRATPVEIVDRVPVSDDRNVEVVSLGQSPPAEAYDQAERGHPVRGGLRWRLELAPGAKQRVEFRYRVTLPAKSEVVGGNRRD
ncbi:MAG TPA: DUF4139 domain-containing protein [Polyangiaceae bacterium]|nr:DUF4139 domain-containing protein [Polyangiaceae bacterium]